MKPTTSFETHLRAIEQKERDAIGFAAIDAIDDARRVRTDLVTMHMAGVTERESSQLANRVKDALRKIDARIAVVAA